MEQLLKQDLGSYFIKLILENVIDCRLKPMIAYLFKDVEIKKK